MLYGTFENVQSTIDIFHIARWIDAFYISVLAMVTTPGSIFLFFAKKNFFQRKPEFFFCSATIATNGTIKIETKGKN